VVDRYLIYISEPYQISAVCKNLRLARSNNFKFLLMPQHSVKVLVRLPVTTMTLGKLHSALRPYGAIEI